jgi:tRNA nucleotidyltransferase (CCA-adding enzyme)
MVEILPPALLALLRSTPELGRSYLVGGCVRDWLLGVPVLDVDIEVYGVAYPELVRVLSRHGRADWVGKAFGVVKLTHPSGAVWDFSVPRRDSKRGPGHKGFDIEFDPDLGPSEASARRDFTINSMLWDPRTGELIDPHGGQADLRAGLLRHTSQAFPEDPLRVLRGMQFAGRFGLHAVPETLTLCRSIAGAYGELAVERVREEWLKWATRSVRPSMGLAFLKDSGWLEALPELAAIVGVPQDPEWHPEGDVWTHTLHAVDALVADPDWRASPAERRLVLMMAVLLHDVGKATCTRTEVRDGRERVISPGHEGVGADLAAGFLRRIGFQETQVDRVVPLVANHMVHSEDPSPRMVRRLSVRLRPSTIDELCAVMTADASARPPRPAGVPRSVQQLRDAAAALQLEAAAPAPLLQGRHLLARGWLGGPALGALLKQAYAAQLDGEFTDLEGALRWVSEAAWTGKNQSEDRSQGVDPTDRADGADRHGGPPSA